MKLSFKKSMTNKDFLRKTVAEGIRGKENDKGQKLGST